MTRKFTSAEIEITSKDRTKGGIDSAKTSVGKLTGFVKNYGAELAVAGASIYGAIKAMSGFVSAASESQTALEDMRASLKSHGTYTDSAFKTLQQYASEIQRVTTIDDEAAAALLTLGTNMGIGTEKIKQATQYAIGLSKAYGIDVNTAMRGVALAMEGQFSLLSRYIPALRDAGSEQEKMTAFTQAGAAGFQQAQDVLKTYAGQMTHVGQQIENIQELLGDKLLPILSKVLDWVQKGIDWFNNLSPAMQNVLTIVGLITTGLVALAPAIGAIIIAAPALGAAITIATGPIGIIIAAIAALAVGIVLLIKHWDEVKAFFVNLWETLKEFWAKIEPFVAMFVPLYGIPKTIIDNWQPILGFFKGIGDGIQVFIDRFTGMIETLRGAGEKFVGVFQNIYDRLVGHSIIPQMTEEMIAALQKLNDFMGYNFVGSIQSTFESVWTSSKSFAEKIKDTLKNLIADFIAALAKQELAIALVYTAALRFGMAAKHFIASAALYAASGAIRSLQKGGEFVTHGPQLLMVGDNPSGREHVKVTPEESPSYNQGGPMGGDVYFDGDKVGRWIAKQVRSKNIPIYKGALVSS